MEPKFQTSFIPKAPVTTGAGTTIAPLHRTNIFSAISTGVFILTLLASGGAFAYKKYLAAQVSQASTDLAAAHDAFQPEKIQEFVDISSRLSAAKTLLEKHVVVSQMFKLLQSLTLSKVRIRNFSYQVDQGVIGVTMDGEAQSYDALAQQASVFSQNAFIKNPDFSNFSLADNGTITFKATATVDPTLVSYKKAIEAMAANNQ
jgi:hypothetical protein